MVQIRTLNDEYNFLKGKIKEAFEEVLLKGAIVTAHNSISNSAVSQPIDCTTYNAVLIYVEKISGASGQWKIALEGASQIAGPFGPVHNEDSFQLESIRIDETGCYLLKGIPDFIKTSAVKVEGDLVISVKVQPIRAL